MKILALMGLALTVTPVRGGTISWTNTSGGNWFVAKNWTPNIVPRPADTASITQGGTYTVAIPTGSVAVAKLNLGGISGIQTLVQGSATPLAVTNNGTVTPTGVLVVTNGGMQGNFTIQTGGQLQFAGTASKVLYSLYLTNQGSVAWSGGFLAVGGTVPATTIISNGGSWEMTSDDMISNGGGTPIWINSGTLRKSAGSGVSWFGALNFTNRPTGVVDAQSGTIQIPSGGHSSLGGTLRATAPARINLTGGTWHDAGGTATGTGSIQFNNGTLALSTNSISGLQLITGDIYIAGAGFQQGGAITNLTLDGAALHVTNSVGAGTLTVNSGEIVGALTVQPAGHLVLATTASKLLYGLNLTNLGTVTWTGGSLGFGGNDLDTTIVSNAGLWESLSDDSIHYGGGSMPLWVNSGTLRKKGGTASSFINGTTFLSRSGGIVEADSGTLQLPSGTTNSSGTLRLNGGKISAFGDLAVTGGTLEGSGAFGVIDVVGGTVSPGQSGPGLISFASGMSLGAGVTVTIDGSGTAPGTQCDQLSVTGPVALSNCTLQVTSLPTVAAGTTFTLIANHGGGAVAGTFKGLAENALLNVGSQAFHIHYASGSGHDVTLVRSSVAGPELASGNLSKGIFTITGAGTPSTGYTIQGTTNFFQWSNVGSVTSDAAGHFTFHDTNAALFRYRFYRTMN